MPGSLVVHRIDELLSSKIHMNSLMFLPRKYLSLLCRFYHGSKPADILILSKFTIATIKARGKHKAHVRVLTETSGAGIYQLDQGTRESGDERHDVDTDIPLKAITIPNGQTLLHVKWKQVLSLGSLNGNAAFRTRSMKGTILRLLS